MTTLHLTPELAAQLRTVAKGTVASDLGTEAIAAAIAVPQGLLDSFLSDDGVEMPLDVADRLASVLGMRLVERGDEECSETSNQPPIGDAGAARDAEPSSEPNEQTKDAL